MDDDDLTTRRVAKNAYSRRPQKVHIQMFNGEEWEKVSGCSSPQEFIVLSDTSRAKVTCRRCANSGKVPRRWLI